MVTLYKKHAMLAARDPMLTKARFAQTVPHDLAPRAIRCGVHYKMRKEKCYA